VEHAEALPVYFLIVVRAVIKRGNFADFDAFAPRLFAFSDRHNAAVDNPLTRAPRRICRVPSQPTRRTTDGTHIGIRLDERTRSYPPRAFCPAAADLCEGGA
jgi:hypothetical protein